MAEGGGDEAATEAGAPAPDVFISYASQDLTIADAIVESLERRRVRCWIAPRDVTPGSLYADEIVGAINDSKVVVLVLSEHSVASPHVGKEIERASSKRRRIIVLRADAALLPRAFEYFLSESQWIDLPAIGAEAAKAKLVEAVHRHLNVSQVAGTIPRIDSAIMSRPAAARWKWMLPVVIAVVASLGWLFLGRNSLPTHATLNQPLPGDGMSVAAAIPEKSVAVLPFVDMSEKKDQEYFSDGLSEELIDMLTKVPELRVPARTSSFFFKGKQTTIADIAKLLGVAHVLEGSVRRSGKTIRITAQLIRADTGYHVWSETYDRQEDDIFKIQDGIAGAVVAALRASLSGNVGHGNPKPINADSYAQLMQAQYFLMRQTLEDQHRAFQYYQRAIDLDSTSATAWAGLSRAIANLWVLGDMTWNEAHQRALQAAERAVELDPQNVDAHIALGKYYFNMGQDYAAAKVEFDKARDLDPVNTVVLFWLADAAMAVADFANSSHLLEQAIATDPLDGETYMMLGDSYAYSSRYAEAERMYLKALDLIPVRAGLHSSLGLALLAKGEGESALREIKRESDATERNGALATAYQNLGKVADARAALAVIESTQAESNAYSIAQNYALRGDRERTFLWLERSYRQHEFLMRLKADPNFRALRDEERYRAILRKVNLPQ